MWPIPARSREPSVKLKFLEIRLADYHLFSARGTEDELRQLNAWFVENIRSGFCNPPKYHGDSQQYSSSIVLKDEAEIVKLKLTWS